MAVCIMGFMGRVVEAICSLPLLPTIRSLESLVAVPNTSIHLEKRRKLGVKSWLLLWILEGKASAELIKDTAQVASNFRKDLLPKV